MNVFPSATPRSEEYATSESVRFLSRMIRTGMTDKFKKQNTMNTKIKSILLTGILLAGFGSCKEDHPTEKAATEKNDNAQQTDDKGIESQVLHLSAQKFKAMGIKVDSIPTRKLSGYVEANGKLEVPPQNEAAITAIIGANITSIKVIEGDQVKKGQILGYLSHPDLIKLQTDYSNAFHKLDYLEKEYQRQKRLYEAEVASGKKFQETEAEYQSTKGLVNGIESQLGFFGVSLKRIRSGNIYKQVPLVSPIDGSVEKVNIKLGQFVPQQKELFEIINTAHVHADLMVFEKDVHKVKKGQTVKFRIESERDSALTAKIYSVGKTFEEDAKAVHVHAEIQNKRGDLFPGMYLSGKIETASNSVNALPEEAVITENGSEYIFTAKRITENGEEKWELRPLKINTGEADNEWVEIRLPQSLASAEKVVWNKAYYLISELKKGETGHHH